MREFVKVMKRIRKNKDFKMILTVSPVPLTATASGNHVLSSTVYSKSVLRAIAGYWAEKDFVDYFPSYEIVINPRNHSTGFSDNLRSVRSETVDVVMRHFFASHLLCRTHGPRAPLAQDGAGRVAAPPRARHGCTKAGAGVFF